MDIRKDIELMTETQLANINLLRELREQADSFDKGLLMSVTAISVINRMNFMFEQCKIRWNSLQIMKE